MIELRQDDILQADAEASVNTVNCVGVMGRGIALQFKKAHPENYSAYLSACKRGEVQPGKMFIFNLRRLTNPRYIINFPTKRHWKGNSRLEYIEEGLMALVNDIRDLGIQSVAIPPLGCGLGGLNWALVRPLIEQAFAPLPDVRVLLYKPSSRPSVDKMVKGTTRPRMTKGRAALLRLMQQYLAGVMDPFISLLEIHKLMYFMQESGEDLRLNYNKAPFGPYATNLRHVLNAIEGHFIQGYGDAEDRPEKEIFLDSEAASQAEIFLRHYPETQERFRRVTQLISGFETPFGMELLSTVHWVGAHENATSLDDAVHKTFAWNIRKRMFTPDQIKVAWETLQEKGWL